MMETERLIPNTCEYMPPASHPRLPTLNQYYAEKSNTTSNAKVNSADHNVQKSGLIYIQVNNQKKIAVRAKVYDNKLDHYILLGAKSANNSSQKYINLRNTHVVQVGDNSIRVTPTKDIDGQSLLFIVLNSNDLESWLDALKPTDVDSPKLCRKTPLMPILVESDEE